MSVFRTSQNLDYPVYAAVVYIGPSGGPPAKSIGFNISPNANLSELTPGDLSAFFAGIRTYFENANWSGYGSGYVYLNYSVTEYAEVNTDVTQ